MNKQILIVSHVYPYPLHDGGKFDIYYRLRALKSLGFGITLIAFYNPALGMPELEPLQKLGIVLHPLPYLRRKISKIFHWKPYSIGSRENRPLLKNIEKQLLQNQTKFVAILSESHHVYPIANELKTKLRIPRLFLRSHNDEPRFMHSLSKTSPLFSIERFFFLAEALKYQFYEPFLMKKLSKDDEVWHISKEECKAGMDKYPKTKHSFLPAGVDLALMREYKRFDKKNVLFAGALFSPNNLQGLFWYIENVHCKLLKKYPDYRLVIAGNTRGANQKKIRQIGQKADKIEFHDTPADLSTIYVNTQIFINPMQHGAGVKLKTIDALLKGLPVVTTSVGNEGTGLVNEKHLLVADKPQEYEKAISLLFESNQQRQQLVANAQGFLKEHYNQEKALATATSSIL